VAPRTACFFQNKPEEIFLKFFLNVGEQKKYFCTGKLRTIGDTYHAVEFILPTAIYTCTKFVVSCESLFYR
jgi:hypothetical protein